MLSHQANTSLLHLEYPQLWGGRKITINYNINNLNFNSSDGALGEWVTCKSLIFASLTSMLIFLVIFQELRQYHPPILWASPTGQLAVKYLKGQRQQKQINDAMEQLLSCLFYRCLYVSWQNWPIQTVDDQRHKYHDHHLTMTLHLTLKMTTAQAVETSVFLKTTFTRTIMLII